MGVENSCFFSGHRNIKSDEIETIRARVRAKVTVLIKKGVVNFISGGARGFDTLCAEEVLKLKEKYPHIKLLIFLPCLEHDKGWMFSEQEKIEDVCRTSDASIYISKEKYDNQCMKNRNIALVSSANYGIFYYKKSISGTGQTYRMAKNKNRIIVNVAV